MKHEALLASTCPDLAIEYQIWRFSLHVGYLLSTMQYVHVCKDWANSVPRVRLLERL